MLLRIFLLSLFCMSPARAAQVRSFACTQQTAFFATCRVDIDGKIESGDNLFLSRVDDSDSLLWNGTRISSTGSFAGRFFYARFLPRLYSLEALEGAQSPQLELAVHSFFQENAGIAPGTTVRIVGRGDRLWKILFPLALRCTAFVSLLALFGYFLWWRALEPRDGWNFPRRELSCTVGALLLALLATTGIPQVLVPVFLEANHFLFLKEVNNSIVLWGLALLLLESRFVDRSSIEKSNPRKIPWFLKASLCLAFFAALAGLTWLPSWEQGARFAQGLGLAVATVLSGATTDWNRAWKRSSLQSLLFFASLLALGAAFSVADFRFSVTGAGDPAWLETAIYVALAFATWRTDRFRRAVMQARAFSDFCRERLQGCETEHMQLLMELLQEEAEAARVSLVSLRGDRGKVIASAGPDALPECSRREPRKLGPLLRRIAKAGHLLYAPVAEELGRDLQNEGLRHSSLGIPIFQGKELRAVLCVMAMEDERISPFDAALMENCIQLLSLDILTIMDQCLLADQAQDLLALARANAGPALEHLDEWHCLQAPEIPLRRYFLAASLPVPSYPLASPLLEGVYREFREELLAQWLALRTTFEFLGCGGGAGEYWLASPAEFRNPLLRDLGSARAALFLAQLLEKQARMLLLREDYRLLGLESSRVAAGSAWFHLTRRGPVEASCMEIDAPELVALRALLQCARSGEVLAAAGDPDLAAALADHELLLSVRKTDQTLTTEGIHSILSLASDNKTARRLEFQALELARKSAARRSAA